MEKDEFSIGQEFYTKTGKWRCTDIGTRVIVAIQMNDGHRSYIGPPYDVPEYVFDENDIDGCSLESDDFNDINNEIVKSQKFREIENAMMFVSSMGFGENSAVLDKSTGKIYYQSEYGDVDEFEDFSEDDYDPEIHIEIPHKNHLDLGKDLVFEFAKRFIPDDYDRVRRIFKKRGAYSRFKDLLDSRGMLQKWYDFENHREQLALVQWCEENKIDLI